MPNIRVILWFALAAILFYNYQAWMHDYPATGAAGSVNQSAAGAPGSSGTTLGDSVPQAANTAPLPAAAAPPPAATAPAAADAFAAPPASAAPEPGANPSQP